MKNLGLKLFSLVIAAMASYYVHSDNNEGVIGISVPIELKGLTEDRVIIYPLVRQAQVSIKGPSFLLPEIYASPPAFRVKIPEGAGNRFVAVLNKKDLQLPPGVEILRVEPSEIEFTFDKLAKKILPIQVTQIGTVTEGHKITEITTDPPQVTVTGPQTELMNMTRIETEPIDLREIDSNTERDISLRFMAKQSELSASVVKVKIIVTNTSPEAAPPQEKKAVKSSKTTAKK